MLRHSATQENLTRLREMGYTVLPPEEGELASGLSGPGRLPEISSIIKVVSDVLESAHHDLRGKKILVTAGPTYEPIDPVRFIGNRSSGKMGFSLANAAAQRGASVTLVAGRVSLPTPRNVRRVDVESSEEMLQAVIRQSKKVDAVIMAAAVSDFAPVKFTPTKIRKEQLNGELFNLELKKTKDVLKELTRKNPQSVVVGFALETRDGVRNAKKKMREKKLDLIILNNPTQRGAEIGGDTNVVTIIAKSGSIERLKKMHKFDVANRILDRISKLL